MLFNWQTSFWQENFSAKAPAPAIILKGPSGIGKKQFAQTLAQYWLCENFSTQHLPCDICNSCRWVNADEHPDFFPLSPISDDTEEGTESSKAKKKITPSQWIKIAQIREQQSSWLITPQVGRYRVCIIEPAEALQLAAQSALLKILEEPPAWLRFILVSNTNKRLMPTIRSRCRIYALPIPSWDQAMQFITETKQVNTPAWLSYHGGMPLIQQTESTQVSSEFTEIEWCRTFLGSLSDERISTHSIHAEPKQMIAFLQKLTFDVAQLKHTGQVHYLPTMQSLLAPVAQSANANSVWHFWRWLGQQQRLQNHPLNAKIVVRDLLQEARQRLKA